MSRAKLLALTATLGVLLVAAGAGDDEVPPLNRKVVAFARVRIGRTVGNGECTTLAVEALRSAGAGGRPLNRGDGDYVWGRPVDSFREALPGDVVQFRDAVFQGKLRVTSRRSVSWRYSYPHHTAIIAEVRERGRVVALLHQNVGPDNVSDAARKVVSETTIRPDSLQKGGKVWIYRPLSRDSPTGPISPDGRRRSGDG